MPGLMVASRWLAGVFACLAVLLLVGCGPNAFPRRDAGASVAAAAPQAPAPLAQVAGNEQPAGRMLFVKDGGLWLWEKGNARQVGDGDTWRQPRWAPDGRRFAYVLRGNSFSDIMLTDLQGGAQTRLTRSQSRILDDNDWNFWPTWSPDGKQIAFVTDANSQNPVLWMMNADGTGRRPMYTPGVTQEIVDEMSWAPDGTRLAMTVFNGGPSQIAVVPVGASATAVRPQGKVITDYPSGALDPAWSPDGRWIAFAAREANGSDIVVMSPDGTSRQRLTTTGQARSPVWSPDGRSIGYLSARGGGFDVWLIDVTTNGSGTLDAANDRQLTHDLGIDATSGISWAP